MNNLESLLQPREAKRQQAKASILIEALSGQGKSGLALLLAKTLAGEWKDVCAVDTESRSLDLFDGITMSDGEVCKGFKKIDLLASYGYAPSTYLLCKKNAKKIGAKAVVFDSLTHMWQQEGGVLEAVSNAQLQNPRLNNYTAWGVEQVKQEKQNIYACIRDNDVHMISTVRVKEKFDIKTGEGLVSLGEQQLQMPDLKYEPDLVLHMVRAGSPDGTPPAAKVIKTRYVIFKKGEVYEFTPALLQQLKEYLEEGADPEELKEQQRQELVQVITRILDEDVSKRTLFPVLKEEMGVGDVALTNLPLKTLQALLPALN